MLAFRTGTVTAVLSGRRGLQRVEVDGEPAYVLTELIGEVAEGDRVVLNTTAVDLGLGTGGWHVVHWNLERDQLDRDDAGHIMKARYTSLQHSVAVDHEEGGGDDEAVARGLPVVAITLHSQLPVAVAAALAVEPSLRISYLMTDGGALPLALSELVAALREAALIEASVTAGQAFGGDIEVVTTAAGLVAAAERGHDLVVAGIGPGNVGTGTALGTSALGVLEVAAAARMVQAVPIMAARASGRDERSRHRGVSHHTHTAHRLDPGPSRWPLPPELATELAGAEAVEPPAETLELLARAGIFPRSMGRALSEDPPAWRSTAAAGALAAGLVRRGRDTVAVQ